MKDKITAFLLKTAEQGLELTPEEVLAEAKGLLVEAREVFGKITKELNDCDEHGSVMWTEQVRRYLEPKPPRGE